MTTLTLKQQHLLALIAELGRVESVYRLAALLNRPYRRVFDNVKALQKAGLLKLIPSMGEGRRSSAIQAIREDSANQPELSYNRLWSSAKKDVDDKTVIASVLADPTFPDLLACARRYGLPRIRQSYRRMLSHGDLKPWAADESSRILNNLEIGFARAA